MRGKRFLLFAVVPAMVGLVAWVWLSYGLGPVPSYQRLPHGGSVRPFRGLFCRTRAKRRAWNERFAKFVNVITLGNCHLSTINRFVERFWLIDIKRNSATRQRHYLSADQLALANQSNQSRRGACSPVPARKPVAT
jgi:hypothetical protein